MNDIQKQSIVDQINKQAAKPNWSFAKVANLTGISKATISAMVNGKWDLIAEEMWRKASAALHNPTSTWTISETKDMKKLLTTFKRAQKNSLAIGISYQPGSGKTAGAKFYAANTAGAFHLNCAEHFTKRLFLTKLGKSMGLDIEGLRTLEIIERIIEYLETIDKPLVIFDEIDKLNDRTLMFFIEFYNRLEGKCGFIMMGAPYLKERVEKGVRKDKMGFREIFSRIGRKFLELGGCDMQDIELICRTNGLNDSIAIKEIYNEYTQKAHDLRRVKRLVEIKKEAA